MGTRNEFITKDDLEKSLGKIKEEIIHEFHIVIEKLTDHMKLLAEGHSGLAERLDRVETRLDRMEKDNERQHIETRGINYTLFFRTGSPTLKSGVIGQGTSGREKTGHG